MLSLTTLFSFAQKPDSIKVNYAIKADMVSFISKIDIADATKDGMYINGYVVNISYGRAKKLTGKTVKITGKVIKVKESVKNANGEIQQGREGETKYINFPRITIIKK